jgi:hypothetical protein
MPPKGSQKDENKTTERLINEDKIPKVCPVCGKKAKEHTRKELDSCRSKYLALKISEVA